MTSRREPYTYVHVDTELRGGLECRGRARVDGAVRGEVRVDGRLQVGPSGRIEGRKLHAGELHVAGIVVVDEVFADSVEVWRGGRLVARVQAPAFAVENGAAFEGERVATGEGRPA